MECGSFVLYYIQRFIEDAPEKFSVDDMPYFVSLSFDKHFIVVHDKLFFVFGGFCNARPGFAYNLQMKEDWFSHKDLEEFCDKLDSLGTIH